MPNSNSVSRHIHHALTEFRRPQLLFLTLSIFLLAILLGNAGAFSGGKIALQLPSSDWTFSARPAMGPAYDSAPVRVYSVTTEAANGPEISRVFIKNQSSRAISAVKLTWRLVNRESPATILGQGQTPLITLRGGLAKDERKEIAFSPVPLMAFAGISKSLVKNGSLTGGFLVEVAADEALYQDKQSWKIASAYKNNNTASSSTFMKAFLSFPSRRIDEEQGGCAKQECKYIETGNPPVSGFKCSDVTIGIFCTNCGTSCSETLCGNPAPPCPPQ
jgi:hypothetical protein